MAGVLQTRSKDLFNLNITFVDGTNATTAVLTGIATEDELVSVWHISTKADNATTVDITSDVSISAADEITFGSDYSSDLTIVFWIDKSL